MTGMNYNTTNMMKYKGFYAQVMEAERLVGDCMFGLPTGEALPVYCSNIFKEYPRNWMRGPGVFVIPVRPNKGLWFNWTMNDPNNTAVILTVKGCNPITGMQTSGFHLERYDSKCPKHGKEFGPDRFCEECGYKWPPQNYVCQAPLWWDGWRNSSDGTVRQFFFTEDEIRDVAAHLIGRDNTVPAFGFAFYRPKVERPKKEIKSNWYYDWSSRWYGSYDIVYAYSTTTKSVSSSFSNMIRLGERQENNKVEDYQPRKEVAVGAGAKIAQDLVEDPYPLDTWKDTPDSVMTIYFVFEEEVDRMLSKGVIETTEKPEGMLEGVQVG